MTKKRSWLLSVGVCLSIIMPPLLYAQEQSGLPKLIDLGATRCKPCIKMAPILDELEQEYQGVFDVEFFDVWEQVNARKAREYGIRGIPTQIFFDEQGKELWRHQGYISKQEILTAWRKLGYQFGADRRAAAHSEMSTKGKE